MSAKLLLVEDDKRVASFVVRGLEAEGYVVDHAKDGREALAMARTYPYAVIVLDRMIPHVDGLQVCRALREENCATLVLMLTAKDSLQDKLDGLSGGADDYLTKPFAFDELLARIGALLRRSPALPAGAAESVLSVADLRLDLAAKRAWRDGREIPLTVREFGLLACLMRNADAVVSRSRLLSEVWNLSFDPGTKLVDVYIRYLRRKVDRDRQVPLIQTVRGFGYMIVSGPMPAGPPGEDGLRVPDPDA
jgi:DNA-binding response OmpR family regulator